MSQSINRSTDVDHDSSRTHGCDDFVSRLLQHCTGSLPEPAGVQNMLALAKVGIYLTLVFITISVKLNVR